MAAQPTAAAATFRPRHADSLRAFLVHRQAHVVLDEFIEARQRSDLPADDATHHCARQARRGRDNPLWLTSSRHLLNEEVLVPVYPGGPAKSVIARPRGRQRCAGALGGHLPLELRDSAYDVEQQSAYRRRGVQRLRDRAELDAPVSNSSTTRIRCDRDRPRRSNFHTVRTSPVSNPPSSSSRPGLDSFVPEAWSTTMCARSTPAASSASSCNAAPWSTVLSRAYPH